MKNLLLPLGNGDVITYELRVTSYELRFLNLQVTIHGLQVKALFHLKKIFHKTNLSRVLTGKNLRQMKLQCLQKVQIWAFGLLVQQINSL